MQGLDAIVWEAEAMPNERFGRGGQPMRFTFVSPQAASMLGHPVRRWLREPAFWEGLIHPEDRSRVAALFERIVKECRSATIEYRLLAADGRIVRVRDRISVARGAEGQARLLRGVMVDTPEAKQTEEELRRNAESYRAFVDQSSEGIWCWTTEPPMPVDLSEDEQVDFMYRNSRLTQCNMTNARMYGLDRPEQLIGARLEDLLPRSDPHNDEYLRSLIRSGYRLVDAESHEVDRNGKPKYFLNNLVGIVENGRLVRAWGSQRDITEMRNAEEETRRQKALFQELFERSPSAILVLDTDDLVMQANRGFERLFQYSRDEVVGRHVNDILVPDDQADEASTLSRMALNGETVRKESVRKRKDGSLVTVSMLGYPIHIDGTVEAIYAIYTDITDRVRANDAIRDLASGVSAGTGVAFFRSLAQHLTKTLDVDFAFVGAVANGAPSRFATLAVSERGQMMENLECEVAGSPVEQVIGRELAYYPEDLLEIFPRDQLSARLGVDSFMGVPLFDSEKRPLGVLTVMHRGPIVHEQLTRSVLQIFAIRAAAELERMRSEEQLRHSQKMEAVGRLAGGIAHDFNNLLTAISGYSDLVLARMSIHEPLRRQVEEIRKAGERAASLTRQLLAFSRKQMLQPKVLDLNAVVADMEKLLRRLIGEDIELRTELQPGLARVRADPSQIEQVILNLAVNARDAMPSGGRLLIQTARLDDQGTFPCLQSDLMYGPGSAGASGGWCELADVITAGQFAMLAITDTGAGMDADVYGHLFEPFFTTKEKGKGTGLGLSMVYGIVKQSNGQICVSTEPGRGTTVRICLPTVRAEPEAGFDSAAGTRMAKGTETILLAEDEEVVRRMAKEILESCGYTVLEAADGLDAFSISEKHTGELQLLLTDVVMPGMNGYDLAKRLALVRPQMRVLYVSGYTGDTLIGQDALGPGTAFLQKPFAPDRLTQKVRELLDRC
ncbi:MAG: PAS domain S-box protein [Acidobacteria bacterium]|nr:PAS domain S-box protein [Acidobacteriota bacterium]